jgi:hypothetical protein
MVKDLRISSNIRKPFLIYDFATQSHMHFLIYEEIFFFFFISVGYGAVSSADLQRAGVYGKLGDVFFLVDLQSERLHQLSALCQLLTQPEERISCVADAGKSASWIVEKCAEQQSIKSAKLKVFITRLQFDCFAYTDKKENQFFFIYKEIQNGAVAKSYMTHGLLIYGEIFAHFLIY